MMLYKSPEDPSFFLKGHLRFIPAHFGIEYMSQHPGKNWSKKFFFGKVMVLESFCGSLTGSNFFQQESEEEDLDQLIESVSKG